MQTAAPASPPHKLPVVLSLLACLFFFCITASTFLNPYVNRNFNRIWQGQMHQMVNGKAHRPFVYRMVVPQIVRSLDSISPPELREWVTDTLIDEPAMQFWMEEKFVAPKHFYRMFLTLCVMLTSIVLYALCLYGMTRTAFASHPQARAIALLAPVIGLAAIPMLTRKVFIYDFTVLLLWTLCLWAMMKRRWIITLLLCALATLNKETGLFLVLIFFVSQYDQMSKRRFLLLTILMAAITVGVKLWVNYHFRFNPGVVFQSHWLLQFKSHSMLNFDPVFFAHMLGYVLLLGAFWREKPVLLRRGLWVIVPLWIAYWWVGYPREFRVFYEFMPFAVPLIAHSLIMLIFPPRQQLAHV